MAERVAVLDYGYIELVDAWGSEERIVEAARMSTGKGFLGWGPKHSPLCDARGEDARGEGTYMCVCDRDTPGDEKLLRFLWENKHATPFEMVGFTIEVQAPIFVFREWHRHRTQSYNEMSARYAPLPDVNYVPSVDRLLVNSKTNKQAGAIKGADELTSEGAQKFQQNLRAIYAAAEDLYQEALKAGVPKELARLHLPVGRYSRMRASTDLRNWLSFLTLRMAPGAQYEIRMYANEVGRLVKQLYPRTWELFSEELAAK